MNTTGLIALLLSLCTLFGIANHRTLRLPMTIGVLVFSLLLSLGIMALNPLIPSYDLQLVPRSLLGAIDLPRTLLDGALSLLLFAGAMGCDLDHLRARATSVALLAILGTLLAVGLLALGAWCVFAVLGMTAPLSWCVVMGAILAPTDPVSVVAMLRRLGLPGPVQAVFAGESLFNDGIGVVVFGVTIGLATGDAHAVTAPAIAVAFVREALGGAVLGAGAGWIALRLIRGVDDPHIDLLASLSLATGAFALADALGLSGPIAVVVAGMSMGTRHGRRAIDAHSRAELDAFWALVDEILNAMLFLLIGFEVLDITPHLRSALACAALIPLSIAVRGASVGLAMLPLRLARGERGRMLGVLTWGGLRGGISVALALGLPPGPLRATLLPVCYGVVVFTIIVQGLTMTRVAARLYPAGGNA